MIDSSTIIKILKLRTIAVVGFSSKIERPSNFVSKYMKENGYKIIPVNPTQKKIGTLECFPNLESINEKVDIVNIFRRNEYVPEIVESAISIKAKSIWMQDSVHNIESATKAKKAGIMVIMNDCLMRQHKRLIRLLK
tara:strand:+ start:1457 stop:1867 length:411 start_codon:yes stop_codon:yes gene_type:complete